MRGYGGVSLLSELQYLFSSIVAPRVQASASAGRRHLLRLPPSHVFLLPSVAIGDLNVMRFSLENGEARRDPVLHDLEHVRPLLP